MLKVKFNKYMEYIDLTDIIKEETFKEINSHYDIINKKVEKGIINNIEAEEEKGKILIELLKKDDAFNNILNEISKKIYLGDDIIYKIK
jgi:hypothetical protein